MKYYKYTNNGYIVCIGTGGMGEEISENEYADLMEVIAAKPARTETSDYRLKEDLTWEAYQIDPPDPDPELDEAEAFDIIFGGAE